MLLDRQRFEYRGCCLSRENGARYYKLQKSDGKPEQIDEDVKMNGDISRHTNTGKMSEVECGWLQVMNV